ncbi:pentapeptide repeat-containing protein [Streptomyces sp. GMY02]|uniref:pentapeptide repeat-containing protein n=1 Tax=Streptomyces sp. GMY02 TaxID=1333528 RepID=UPI0020B7EECB|nr:pentapeptide repeat-containing protein [Streptomyces sp. GMY02]
MVMCCVLWWWGGPVLRALVPMARPEWDRLTPEAQTTAEGQYRLAVVQAVAALGAGVALAYTARNYRLSRRGQVTERFTKALERLGSEEMEVRIGGVLALEQIVQDSPDQATHAAQVLNAFIRQRAPLVPAVPDPKGKTGMLGAAALRTALNHPARVSRPSERPEADLQSALSALTRPASRRHVDPTQTIDLTGLHLVGARLDGANLAHAQLEGATLAEAWLSDANLAHARLKKANLTNARLEGASLVSAEGFGVNLAHAHLKKADLSRSNLREADLTHAQLEGATLAGAWLNRVNLAHAHLKGADLSNAHLGNADLGNARLWKSNLTKAWLTRANLSGADLLNATLERAHLNRARLRNARLDNANLSGAWLDGADLTGASLWKADLRRSWGLTSKQVLSAHPRSSTMLPPDITANSDVVAQITTTEAVAAARLAETKRRGDF